MSLKNRFKSKKKIGDLVCGSVRKVMNFPLPVDRGISRYLNTCDFVSFRKTSRLHYNDSEAWSIRGKDLPLNCPGIGVKKKIGLHYLLGCALQFNEWVGSDEWFQAIVNWIDYKSSIKIMYLFLKHYRVDFFTKMSMSEMSSRQRIVWWRLCHRNSRLFKRPRIDYVCDERTPKRLANTFSMYGPLQQCGC